MVAQRVAPRICAYVGIGLATTFVALAGPDARAADGQGQYAVRGAALVSCAAFSQARKNQSDVYLVVASWIDGYITGVNQYAQDTYDVAPYESTQLFTTVAEQYCRDHPDDRVVGVLLDTFKRLWPARLTHQSEKVPISLAGHDTRLYVEIIRRMQRALQSEGYYKGPINGEFSPKTADALKKFQKTIAFKQTGFPDQATLWRLLRSDKKGRGGS